MCCLLQEKGKLCVKKNENTIIICPYCKNKCLYEYCVNGEQMMLCLNCGQLFPAEESEISAEESEISAEDSEQLLKTMDQSVGKTDDG